MSLQTVFFGTCMLRNQSNEILETCFISDTTFQLFINEVQLPKVAADQYCGSEQ